MTLGDAINDLMPHGLHPRDATRASDLPSALLIRQRTLSSHTLAHSGNSNKRKKEEKKPLLSADSNGKLNFAHPTYRQKERREIVANAVKLAEQSFESTNRSKDQRTFNT